jgi:cell division protein FtsI (penicillin-binding protein 3)
LYISSFVGYFPVDKPKYSCIVVIHKPNKNKGYYGNIVAAPVFKEIAHKIYSNTPLVENYSEKKYIKNSGEKKINAINELNSLIMPDLKDFGINELIPILENAGFSVVIDGNGLNVSQSILPGTKLSKGQEIKINLI